MNHMPIFNLTLIYYNQPSVRGREKAWLSHSEAEVWIRPKDGPELLEVCVAVQVGSIQLHPGWNTVCGANSGLAIAVRSLVASRQPC